MKIRILSASVCAFIVGIMNSATATTINTTTTPSPFSQYSQIQNVQNYSSNPFWNPDSPYNQRMPVPVYVQGTDVSTADCQAIVGALVASYCASRNNCVGVDVDDARPTLTVQLASLPNHNYVTPCGGYIDTEFEKYVSENAIAAPTGTTVAFPTATGPNTAATQQGVQFQNPYQQQLPVWNGEPWALEKLQREQELKNLQSANSTGDSVLVATAFPTTAADLSFTERMQNDAAGYAPYKDASAYRTITIESEEDYNNRVNAFCTKEIARLSIIGADLATAQKCRDSGIPISDCLAQLNGKY